MPRLPSGFTPLHRNLPGGSEDRARCSGAWHCERQLSERRSFQSATSGSLVLSSLACYDRIYTPRRANIEDLRDAGCGCVQYLPFAYAPEIHYPETCENAAGDAPPSDVVFAGGGDGDRIPYAKALINAGLTLALYGGQWNRFPAARPYWRGYGSASTIRKALKSSKVALCLGAQG